MAASPPQFPVPGEADSIQTALKAGLNLVPYLGGAIAQLVDVALPPVFETRLQVWGTYVDDMLRTLGENFVGPEDLASNEEWVSAFARASRVAAATHLSEKLEMLRDILVNLALKGENGTGFVGRFIRFVDEFEPEHFIVLKFCASPLASLDQQGLDPSMAVEPWLAGRPAPVLQADIREYVLAQFASKCGISELMLDITTTDLDRNGLASTSIMAESHVFDNLASQEPDLKPFATNVGLRLLEWVNSQDALPTP